MHVGELMKLITRNRITQRRFRVELSPQTALDYLAACYRWHVEYRGGTFRMDENMEQVMIKLANYLTQEMPKFGLMFCGTCGNGKTTLVLALQLMVNTLSRQNHFTFLDKDFHIGFEVMDVREILQMAKDIDKFRELKRRDMLAIDDMGKEPTEIMNYGNVLNPVVELIEYRYNRQLFTVITTNLNPREIKQKYGTRIADRFNEMLEVIVFKDGSYRNNDKQRGST